MFEVGDHAIVTRKIVRRDGRSKVEPGERVKITGVYKGEKYEIIDIQPYSCILPINDICCDRNGPLKWSS